jgi:signal peptidase I
MEDNYSFRHNTGSSPKQDPAYGVGTFLMEIIKVFVLAVVIIMPIRMFLFQPFFVQGASMEPNYHNGEYLLVNEFGYKHTDVGFSNNRFFSIEPFRELKRGDVVVFRYPKNPSQFFVKRVVGLPGERIVIEDQSITIYNDEYMIGMTLDESEYLQTMNLRGSYDQVLNEDEYYVLGDNRDHSHDSRSWGPLDKEYVIGKVFFRAWPLTKLGPAS